MRFVWTLEKLKEEALKYKSRTEFQKKNKSANNAAFNMGVMDTICAHMPKFIVISGENHPNCRWTLKNLQKEALKYNNRMEFQKKGSAAYQSAYKRGLLNEICKHMKESATAPWAYKDLQKEALKYKTRADFIKNNFDAYKSAWRRKILDIICLHMKISSNISKDEKNLFDIIKNIYPKTQQFKDTKVKIDNKPHIQGLYLDIYVPELRKGIEFDGTYWHSSEGLKRSRKHWPDNDIINYHEIKDSYFKSKGIEILHIKEEDWVQDKQACIDKCLEFLRK